MLHSGTVTPATANPTPLIAPTGTPGQTSYQTVGASMVIIQCKTGDTAGGIRVVAMNPDGTFPTTGGNVIVPGASLTLPWYGPPRGYNLAQIAVITNGTTDVVDFLYATT